MAPRTRRRLKIKLLILLGRMPQWARLFLVRRVAPSFTVGTVCRIARHDGAVLLVSQPYRRGWGLPGGLIRRGEDAAAGVAREVREELGVDLVITGDPTVVVDARFKRVDVIFPGRLRPDDEPAPNSAEILEARWFMPDEMPPLQAETKRALDALGRRPAVS